MTRTNLMYVVILVLDVVKRVIDIVTPFSFVLCDGKDASKFSCNFDSFNILLAVTTV